MTWYLLALVSFAVLVAGAMLPKGFSRVGPPRAVLVDPRRRLRVRFDREVAARSAGRALTAATVLVGAFMAVVLLYFLGLVVFAALLGSSQSWS
jgi:hypothetical protein